MKRYDFVCLLRQGLCIPGISYIGQAGLELRHLPASAYQMLELKLYTNTPRLKGIILSQNICFGSQM